jgi:hypothetical protein
MSKRGSRSICAIVTVGLWCSFCCTSPASPCSHQCWRQYSSLSPCGSSKNYSSSLALPSTNMWGKTHTMYAHWDLQKQSDAQKLKGHSKPCGMRKAKTGADRNASPAARMKGAAKPATSAA